jgi:hypothetical protein
MGSGAVEESAAPRCVRLLAFGVRELASFVMFLSARVETRVSKCFVPRIQHSELASVGERTIRDLLALTGKSFAFRTARRHLGATQAHA